MLFCKDFKRLYLFRNKGSFCKEKRKFDFKNISSCTHHIFHSNKAEKEPVEHPFGTCKLRRRDLKVGKCTLTLHIFHYKIFTF